MTVINTNIKSLIAQDTLTKNTQRLGTAMERLSTGKRINSASDDATGLAIATRLDAQTRGLQSAIKNANDSISTVETAEGAMQEVTSILQRMRNWQFSQQVIPIVMPTESFFKTKSINCPQSWTVLHLQRNTTELMYWMAHTLIKFSKLALTPGRP